MTDDEFLDHIAITLGALPGATAVALGGSRAQGTWHVDSDWDFSIYYRGSFDVESVRALGWDGSTTDIGGWGPVFNGGGKFLVQGRSIDIHYRDLDLVERIRTEIERGEYWVQPLLFHQAGVPSYILIAELAMNRVLSGAVPTVSYPAALRASAPERWLDDARLTLYYARHGHAVHGRGAQCAGLLAMATCFAAHAVLARDGVWVTNEKQLLTKAGLRGVDGVVAALGGSPGQLLESVDRVEGIIRSVIVL